MRRKNILTVAALLLAATMAAGCTSQSGSAKTSNNTDMQTEEDKKVASGSETVEAVEVVDDDMSPVYANAIKDGEYDITVDSSSSMFKIAKCTLIVKDDEMSAVMTMSGKGYAKLYMGTAKDAARADDDKCITFKENEDGQYTFEVPVEALDMGIDCAALSKKKDKWYDRKLVFLTESVPLDAFEDGAFTTLDDLNIESGTYTVDVVLEGGSGKSSVESPTRLTVRDGKSYAVITFKSPNYDYMLVDDVRYEPINDSGNSAFEIPVEVFDKKMSVIADTVAMSTPHEIEYTLTFDSASIKAE